VEKASLQTDMAISNVESAVEVQGRRKRKAAITVLLAMVANFLHQKSRLNATNAAKGNIRTEKKILHARPAQKGNSKRMRIRTIAIPV